jgi:hypothetical protein
MEESPQDDAYNLWQWRYSELFTTRRLFLGELRTESGIFFEIEMWR